MLENQIKHPVDKIYEDLVKQGYTQKDAAKEAQKRTGISMVTKQPIRPKRVKFTSQGITYGQQDAFKKHYTSLFR